MSCPSDYRTSELDSPHPNLPSRSAIHAEDRRDAMKRTFTSALLLGVTAGLRSMTAPALLALAQQQPGARRIWLLSNPRVSEGLTLLAVAELIVDKLPSTPARIKPGPLGGRLLSGAMCGAAVAPGDQTSGALLGIAGALAGSFAGYFIRKAVVRASGVPDALFAIAEDGVAIAMGVTATMEDRGGDEGVLRMPTAHVA
jgi:uncharacterized membrane protein